MEKSIRWAIMGLGSMAQQFAGFLGKIPSARIAGAASRNLEKAEAFAKKYGVEKVYGSYEEMLADPNLQADIIYIATPHFQHYENIRLCLDYRKHILCEKPICSHAQQYTEVMERAQELGCFLFDGMWSLRLPVYQKARAWIAEGKIGAVQFIRLDFSKPEVVDAARSVFDVRSGGVLQDYGVYAVAFAVYFLGQECFVESAFVHRKENGLNDDWKIVLSNGKCRAFMTISSCYDGDRQAQITGEKGRITFPRQFNRCSRILRQGMNGEILEEFSTDYSCEGFEYELKEVSDTLLCGKKVPGALRAETTRKILQVIDDIYENGVELA